ncbi:MAG: hypothetical protein HGB10_06970 [Coriobacteriia bacterium]|nr:hypothetical protein [Coriobacteriia bacterium]
MRQRSRSALNWVLLVVVAAACVAIAFASYQLAGFAWDQVVEYQSPYVTQPGAQDTSPTVVWVPPVLASLPTTSPVVAERVVLVIVDGMRDDIARTGMGNLSRLRTYGADVSLTVPQPSLSYPNWTTILTGAPQDISGVTTNWFEGRVPVPTLMEHADVAGKRVAVVGPEDFEQLYGVAAGPSVSLRPWPKGGYLTGTLVDDALRIAKAQDPELLVLHVPDLDEAGHEFGGASQEYRDVAYRIDVDLGRLIDGLQSDETVFVVVADHGHIDSGGHGGWEPTVTTVSGVFAGAGVKMGSVQGRLEDVAPTVAALGGFSAPSYSEAGLLRAVVATESASLLRMDDRRISAFESNYVRVVTDGIGAITATGVAASPASDARAAAAQVREERLGRERRDRLPMNAAAFVLALVAILLIAFASWRACVAALAGVFGYYVVYNVLFFGVHGYNWSLSAFNTETFVKAFMNGRMIEAIIAGVAAAAVAGVVYPLLRTEPKGSRQPEYRSGWLVLGPVTILAIQATLALQIAWYSWWYGLTISWVLPNFMWAFKADLDMVQVTALGVAALLAPLVTYLVGRYHPKVQRVRAGEEAAGSKT